MSYNFDIAVDPDFKLSTPTPGTLHLEFEKEGSLFNAVESLKEIEMILLLALGYGGE